MDIDAAGINWQSTFGRFYEILNRKKNYDIVNGGLPPPSFLGYKLLPSILSYLTIIPYSFICKRTILLICMSVMNNSQGISSHLVDVGKPCQVGNLSCDTSSSLFAIEIYLFHNTLYCTEQRKQGFFVSVVTSRNIFKAHSKTEIYRTKTRRLSFIFHLSKKKKSCPSSAAVSCCIFLLTNIST